MMELEDLNPKAREALYLIGEGQLAQKVCIEWNPRMRTTAGRAFLAQDRIEMNPRLVDFGAEQVHNTLLHELAHLVAWRRTRERGHGVAWRTACADLGIPNESVTHDLPLSPRRTQRKRFRLKCPHCEYSFDRVRKPTSKIACGICCKKYNQNRYSEKYLMELYALQYEDD